jgi:hypothetical protein
MTGNPHELVREAMTTLQKVAERYVGAKPDNRAAVEQCVTSALESRASHDLKKHLSYTFDWTDVPERMHLRPGNLFTALIALGVEWGVAKDYTHLKEGAVVWQDCTIEFREGKMLVTPGKPAEFITIDWTTGLED